jgi:hypothetical protein
METSGQVDAVASSLLLLTEEGGSLHNLYGYGKEEKVL